MKKNIFDPFMQVNFENAIKESKPVEGIKNSNSFNNSEVVFMEKRVSFRTPQIVPGFVILITSESIGENNQVGKELLRDFLLEITNLLDLPEYVIFVNDGVKVLKNNIEIIKNIKKLGTKISVSNESLDTFNVSTNFEFVYKVSSTDIAKKMLFAKKFLKL